MKPQRTRDSRRSIKKKKGYGITGAANRLREIEQEKRKRERQKKNEVGELSEEKANLALDNLQEKLHELIVFQHAAIEKNSAKDHHFIDHMLIFIWPENERIEFQIKNSYRGAEEHKKLHPGIPVVVSHVSKQEIEQGAFSNIEEAEKEILDKLFKEYFAMNYNKQHYNKFLKEAYGG